MGEEDETVALSYWVRRGTARDGVEQEDVHTEVATRDELELAMSRGYRVPPVWRPPPTLDPPEINYPPGYDPTPSGIYYRESPRPVEPTVFALAVAALVGVILFVGGLVIGFLLGRLA